MGAVAPVDEKQKQVGEPTERRRWPRLPEYESRVWLKWVALTVLVFVPIGALTGPLMPYLEYGVLPRLEPPPENWDSRQELLWWVPIGIWLWVVPWTAIYFENVNTRYRVRVGGHARAKTPGFGLAVTALVFSTLFVVPIGVAIACVAWWRISATGNRYARGSATVATVFATAVPFLVFLGFVT